ncbi:unnamed protein product [Darwinula stevensoni]|uniref:Uncharacterized protein n=1 Tax=Darwinula stevensoni TaxID=69355 RepID=A0A7R9A4T2_9CRUS|nr:unnamed protein product [Darwinula stevensoni]CAG0893189.1 unnamed protein product [Darwinula stevensoni]
MVDYWATLDMDRTDIEDRFRIVRRHLDDLGYHQTLPLEALPLVERLFYDLLHTTDSLKRCKEKGEKLEKEKANISAALQPYQEENAALLKENNELNWKILRQKEEFDKELMGYQVEIRRLKNEIQDLGFFNERYANQVKSLQLDLKKREMKLSQLYDGNNQAVIVVSGNGGKKQMPVRKQQMEITSLLPPSKDALKEKYSSRNSEDRYSLDLIEMADKRMTQLEEKLQKLHKEHNLCKDDMAQLQNKDTSGSKLRREHFESEIKEMEVLQASQEKEIKRLREENCRLIEMIELLDKQNSKVGKDSADTRTKEKSTRPEVEPLTRPSSADRDKSARIKRVENLRREKTATRSKPNTQNQCYDEDTQKILEGIERLKMKKVAISRSASTGDVMLQRDIQSSSSSSEPGTCREVRHAVSRQLAAPDQDRKEKDSKEVLIQALRNEMKSLQNEMKSLRHENDQLTWERNRTRTQIGPASWIPDGVSGSAQQWSRDSRVTLQEETHLTSAASDLRSTSVAFPSGGLRLPLQQQQQLHPPPPPSQLPQQSHLQISKQDTMSHQIPSGATISHQIPSGATISPPSLPGNSSGVSVQPWIPQMSAAAPQPVLSVPVISSNGTQPPLQTHLQTSSMLPPSYQIFQPQPQSQTTTPHVLEIPSYEAPTSAFRHFLPPHSNVEGTVAPPGHIPAIQVTSQPSLYFPTASAGASTVLPNTQRQSFRDDVDPHSQAYPQPYSVGVWPSASQVPSIPTVIPQRPPQNANISASVMSLPLYHGNESNGLLDYNKGRVTTGTAPVDITLAPVSLPDGRFQSVTLGEGQGRRQETNSGTFQQNGNIHPASQEIGQGTRRVESQSQDVFSSYPPQYTLAPSSISQSVLTDSHFPHQPVSAAITTLHIPQPVSSAVTTMHIPQLGSSAVTTMHIPQPVPSATTAMHIPQPGSQTGSALSAHVFPSLEPSLPSVISHTGGIRVPELSTVGLPYSAPSTHVTFTSTATSHARPLVDQPFETGTPGNHGDYQVYTLMNEKDIAQISATAMPSAAFHVPQAGGPLPATSIAFTLPATSRDYSESSQWPPLGTPSTVPIAQEMQRVRSLEDEVIRLRSETERLRNEKDCQQREVNSLQGLLQGIRAGQPPSQYDQLRIQELERQKLELQEMLPHYTQQLNQMREDHRRLQRERDDAKAAIESMREGLYRSKEQQEPRSSYVVEGSAAVQMLITRLENEKVAMRQELARVKSDRDTLMERMKAVTDIQRGEKGHYDGQLKALKLQVVNLEKERQETVARMNSQKVLVATLQEQVKGLQQTLQATKTQADQQRTNAGQMRYLAEQTERNLRDLQEQMTLKTAKLQTSSQKAEDLLKETGSLKEEMEKMRNQLSDSRAAIATLDRDKDAMQNALDEKAERIQALEEEKNGLQEKCAVLQAKVSAMETKLDGSNSLQALVEEP